MLYRLSNFEHPLNPPSFSFLARVMIQEQVDRRVAESQYICLVELLFEDILVVAILGSYSFGQAKTP